MTSRLSLRIGILLVVVVTLLVGSSVFAQGPLGATSNPLTQVIAKLDQILAVLAPAKPEPVTLRTGVLLKHPTNEQLVCSVLNAGTSTLSMTITSNDGSETFSLSPGFFLSRSPAGLITIGICEFSFVGFAKDVRANAIVKDILSQRASILEVAR
jgi:hypothetical protein